VFTTATKNWKNFLSREEENNIVDTLSLDGNEMMKNIEGKQTRCWSC
jgi:hypothetical protein